jgi:PadR family transcriptional regulator, regulatory protein PadR
MMAGRPLGLLQGTVDVLILRTLAWAPMHGYGVSKWIADRSEGALAVEDAALYQALHRLERKGLVASEWGTSEKNHRAKYYSLTPTGRAQLQSEVAELRQYMAVLFRVLEPA